VLGRRHRSLSSLALIPVNAPAIKKAYAAVAVSAVSIPLHFVASELSMFHLGLECLGVAAFILALSVGVRCYRQAGRCDERRSRFLEPALVAFATVIVHGMCTPLLCHLPK
jgi:hypothetical protein